nr:MAG TPA: hypothetical protein [Caudoviricetes sp.]
MHKWRGLYKWVYRHQARKNSKTMKHSLRSSSQS